MFLMELMVKFVDFGSRIFQGLPSRSCDAIDATPPAANILHLRGQQGGTLHPVQQGIERAGTDPIAVVLQFFHHCQSEKRLLSSMDQHMYPYETGEKIPLVSLL